MKIKKKILKLCISLEKKVQQIRNSLNINYCKVSRVGSFIKKISMNKYLFVLDKIGVK